MKNRTPCADHGQTNPCPSCAADHKVGDHKVVPHTDTCRACRSDARPVTTPTTPTPPARRTRAVLDVAALAAGDDTLTHLTEV